MSDIKFYSREKLPEDTCYWSATLKNGEVVYQDDAVPIKDGRESAWVRLGKYLKQENQRIDRFAFHFRSNWFDMPYSPFGFYFANGMTQSVLFSKKGVNYFVGGSVLDDQKTVEILWVKIPELIIINKFNREISKCRAPSLITYS